MKIAKHTKPNAKLEKADRPAHRVIAKNRFATLDTIDDVIARLIGVYPNRLFAAKCILEAGERCRGCLSAEKELRNGF